MDQQPVPVEEKKVPWYFKSGSIVVAILTVGPLALPLIWFHPKMSQTKKVIWTVVTLVLTYFIVAATMEAVKKISQSLQDLKGIMP